MGKVCSECHHPHARRGETCSPSCKVQRDLRLRRERRSGVAGGGEPARATLPLRVPPPAAPSPHPSISTGQPAKPIAPDHYLDDAFAAGRSLFRSFDTCEAVTIHRDGTLSMLRVGPANEPVQDVLRDLGRAAGVTRRRGHHDPAGADLDFGGAR